MKTILRTLLFLISLIPQLVFAQAITGKVVDENRQPLIGVVVRTATDATTTNELGLFSIKSTDLSTDSISFSYIGFALNKMSINDFGLSDEIALSKSSVLLSQIEITPDIDALKTITKIDILNRPVASSQDLLTRVPGLFISQHAGGGKAEQIFLRGFDIDHGTDISIGVDGMPVNMVSHAHGQGYSDLHFLIPETVEKIDFGKGPYNTDKGNFATAGYVNFKTKDRIDQSRVSLEVGQFNNKRVLALLNLTHHNWTNHTSYLAAEYLYNDGPFLSPQALNRVNAMGKYTIDLKDGSAIKFQASHFNSNWNASGQIPQRLVDDGSISRFGSVDDKEGGKTSRSNFAVNFIQPKGKQGILTNSAYYVNYNFDLFSNFTFFLEDPINGDQIRQRENRNILGYSTKYSTTNTLGPLTLKSEYGIGVRNDNVRNNELARTLNRETNLEQKAFGNINETNTFSYANVNANTDHWTVNTGLRLDYFYFAYMDILPTAGKSNLNQSVLAFSPKVNVIYQPSKDNQYFLKLGRGFHSNDTRVVTADVNTLNRVLPYAYGADLGTIFKPLKNTLFTTALWGLYLEQEFVYVGDAGVVEPSGATKRLGIDLGIRTQVSQKLNFDFDINYTYARSIDADIASNYIPLAPDLTSTGGLTYQVYKNFGFGTQYKYIKNRSANEDGSITALGYSILNMNINYTYKTMNIGLQCENLFNRVWNEAQFATTSRLQNEPAEVEELHFTPGNPRNIKVVASYRF